MIGACRTAGVLWAAMAAVMTLAAAGVPAAARAAPSAYAAQADALVRAYADAGWFSGTVLVAKDGRPVFARAYGLANREWNVPTAADTRYRIGSLTKQFTAVAILQLVQDGKVRLDDPISRVYPEAPAAWSNLTLRHLLTHTSGIPPHPSFRGAFAGEASRAWRPEEIVALSRDKPLAFPPGSRFAYDNTGYDLLGLIVERLSGMSYARYLDAHVLEPAGLASTRCEGHDDITPRRAAGYQRTKDTVRAAPPVSPTLMYAAGCLYSTTGDLLAWDRALHGGKVVGREALAEMFRDQGFHYGFGEFIQDDHGHRVWSHGGGLPGFASALNHYPDDGLTVVVLSNLDGANAARIAGLLGRLYLEPQLAQGPRGPPAAEEIAAYPGRYRLPTATLEVTARDGRLYAGLVGQPATELVRETGRSFFMAGAPFQISFAPGRSSPQLVLHQDLADTVAPRSD